MARILTLWALALTATIGSSGSQFNQDIPPDHARIYGVVIQFSSKFANSGACKQNPCWALVAVRNVKGYGSGFRGALSPGDTISVKFSSTLLPTQTLFPERTNHLPGLGVNDEFSGDLKQQIDLLSQSDSYEISDYEKMN
ncbi:hypothetical protein [Ekhidna sp.]